MNTKCLVDGRHQYKKCGHWSKPPCSLSRRKKISAALTGRKSTPAQLEKKNNTLRSPEGREKMRIAMLQSVRHIQAVHDVKFRQKQSDAATRRRAQGWGNTRSFGKMGYREDIGIYVRSRWEANYARFLNLLVREGVILRWEYEPLRFEFEKIKRGTRSYLPDFKVTLSNNKIEWHEVKGYWTQKGKTAVKRFRKYYPDEVLVIVDYAMVKARRDEIVEWEE